MHERDGFNFLYPLCVLLTERAGWISRNLIAKGDGWYQWSLLIFTEVTLCDPFPDCINDEKHPSDPPNHRAVWLFSRACLIWLKVMRKCPVGGSDGYNYAMMEIRAITETGKTIRRQSLRIFCSAFWSKMETAVWKSVNLLLLFRSPSPAQAEWRMKSTNFHWP